MGEGGGEKFEANGIEVDGRWRVEGLTISDIVITSLIRSLASSFIRVMEKKTRVTSYVKAPSSTKNYTSQHLCQHKQTSFNCLLFTNLPELHDTLN